MLLPLALILQSLSFNLPLPMSTGAWWKPSVLREPSSSAGFSTEK